MLPLDVDGISGEDVKRFLVSRDGSRLIAVIREKRRTTRSWSAGSSPPVTAR